MGRPTVIDLREVVNALLYLNRTGCPWRLLPSDFPNWNTVRYCFDAWTLDGTFIRINDVLRRRARSQAGRNPEPSAGIIDSQTIRTTEAGGEREDLYSESMVYLASIGSLLRCLAPTTMSATRYLHTSAAA